MSIMSIMSITSIISISSISSIFSISSIISIPSIPSSHPLARGSKNTQKTSTIYNEEYLFHSINPSPAGLMPSG